MENNFSTMLKAERERLAQMDRAPARHAGGRWFKSNTTHLRKPLFYKALRYFAKSFEYVYLCV